MVKRARLDKVCADAVDLARAAAEETGDGVGEYLGAEPEAERVATHRFECTLPGYRGWRWAVVVVRAPRARNVTVSETAFLPGPDALTAPEWVPWAERLRAGDVGVGDLLPTEDADERLMPAYAYSDDDGVEDVAYELGVGRARVMSREGRIECAERWYEGDSGPDSEIATAAPRQARCGTCGFYLQLAGSLRQAFGVCGNLYATDDGRVVSADHGCGAHSEVLSESAEKPVPEVDHLETVYDDNTVEPVDVADSQEPPAAEDSDSSSATDEPDAAEPTAEAVVVVPEAPVASEVDADAPIADDATSQESDEDEAPTTVVELTDGLSELAEENPQAAASEFEAEALTEPTAAPVVETPEAAGETPEAVGETSAAPVEAEVVEPAETGGSTPEAVGETSPEASETDPGSAR